MGKINENIVCPICNKLFRSENVVFKHVKHCTGPSPNRSDSDKSPRRFRESQDSESKSSDSKLHEMDVDDSENSRKEIRSKRKSRDTNPKSMANKEEIIIIENTPIKLKSEKEDMKRVISKKSILSKSKSSDKEKNLICQFCGKTFRQLSYLVNHKLQHEKDESKKYESEISKTTKSVFSCEVCKKEFRKLHHLVQHRIIHNTGSVLSAKLSRKSSAEQIDNRAPKHQNVTKQSEDASAGFRCEPCDKSFRKLHHLVEHRETHDGINRQKNTTNLPAPTDKDPTPPQCEICKKTFRKLHHLIEHKEQHLETSSEKSDDIKSSLSTKDIIHECSLCYMVFPNEHSLNKHTIICQRKKRQSASKQNKPTEELESIDDNKVIGNPDEDLETDNDVVMVSAEIITNEKDVQSEPLKETLKHDVDKTDIVKSTIANAIDLSTESPKQNITINKPKEHTFEISSIPEQEGMKVILDIPNSHNKSEAKQPIKNQETPNKKAKDKIAPTITKRHKPNLPLPIVESTESTDDDDDEVRYMLNPDYKTDDNVEGKLFMKVRANKRNSLQIERPNSKDLVKRRISLQHPPKVPRLKSKPIQSKAVSTNAAALTKNITKIAKLDTTHFTDSDDSDIKYSFPKTVPEKVAKLNVGESKEIDKKVQRKSLAEKRKSLSSIAKRKSLGKTIGAKHKSKPSPLKPIKKRAALAEHRCDCGQLFSSAALLSRHTTLAHTPPRIRRRRRSPSPDNTTIIKQQAPGKSISALTKPEVSDSRKSSVKIDSGNSKAPRLTATRKSSVQKAENKTVDVRKSLKTNESLKGGATSNSKVTRYAAHKGVPVPDKMRKLMEKSKK